MNTSKKKSGENKIPTTQEIEKIAEDLMICNASEWLKMFSVPNFIKQLTPEERSIVQRASERNFKIIPGMPYIEEHGVYRDKPYISTYVKEIHELCLKYELYTYTGNKSQIKLN